MPKHLTPQEVSLLALDTAHTPGQVGTVAVFEPAQGAPGTDFGYEQLLTLVGQRIAFAPRYRQRVRAVPGRLAAPFWVDDEQFDLTYHVRCSALPRPGSDDQLRELVGRVLARRLDRSRPLWELYLVEGLADGRFALLTKSHLALVDGIDTVDLVQVLLDGDPAPDDLEARSWRPAPEPSPLELAGAALWESAQDPVQAVANLRGLITGTLGLAVAVGELIGGGLGAGLGDLAGDALRGGRPTASSPLAGPVSQQRRFVTVSLPLRDLQAVHAAHEHTVNDVVLAVISGGLRDWLLTRGEPVTSHSILTALVPMSVPETDGDLSSLGSRVAPHLQSLPIGEPNPLMRLHQVAYATRAHRDTGQAVDARELSEIAGFAPATLHVLGVRVSAETVRRRHDIVITNVPGPQRPLFLGPAPMSDCYPVLPLSGGHLLSIGVTSYNGEVFVGLTADRDAIADLDVLSQCLHDALAELVDTTDQARRRQPTRQASAARRAAAAQKTQKAAAQKVPAKRTAAQKTAAKKTVAKETVAQKTVAQKTAAQKTVTKKAAVTKSAPSKPAAP